MTLHPLAEQFAGVSELYERGRPEVPLAVPGALAAELRLAPGARVLDLAAGTGKLTRALHEAGLDVVAVEPQAELRRILAERVGSERVRDGVAEAIPLPDSSFDAVTVGSAFHWFDAPAALSEIRRVLRPGGGLANVVTSPDWRDTSWAHELGTLMESLRPEHPGADGPPWQDAVQAAGGWSQPDEIRVTIWHPADLDRIIDYLASVSWVAAMPAAQRTEALGRARELILGGETPAHLAVQFTIGLTRLLEPSS
jgi:SAM-dependent methyltransferase